MESLPHDLVGHILERAPVKSLLRFKAVSKQWKSTIESRFFQNRQFKHRQQSGGPPDVLMVSVRRYEDGYDSDPETDPLEIESLRTLELGSSSSVRIPTPWENEYHFVCQNSCDGLVCLYYPVRSGFVVNPTSRWHRVLPLSNYQKTIIGIGEDDYQKTIIGIGEDNFRFYSLGFGKDKFTGTYKPVVLYNSQEKLGLENATTCEVFDFDTNAWRYVTPSAPYRVTGLSPAYLDGSLYWLTDDTETETKVLSLDLHTEAFQVISKTPFAGVSNCDMVIATLDNRLCVSAYMDDEFINQDVWLFNSGDKTWDKIYSIDLVASRKKLRMNVVFALMPLALLDGEKKNKKKKKLLYCSRWLIKTLAIQDPETQSCDAAFTEGDSIGYPVCYFPSLISIQ